MPSKQGEHRGERWSRLPKTDGRKHRPGTLNPDAGGNFKVRNEIDRWVGFVREAEARGILPIHVMMDNIEFEHKQVQEWTAELVGICAELKDDPALSPDAKAFMVARGAELLMTVKGNRSRAQQYACDLAPYLHARLSNVAIAPGADYETALAESKAVIPAQIVNLSPDDAAATYLRLVRGEAPQLPKPKA